MEFSVKTKGTLGRKIIIRHAVLLSIIKNNVTNIQKDGHDLLTGWEIFNKR